jgi:hypothetical protein
MAYIRSERRPDGLWEFDKVIGLPPDSDVIACALAAFAQHGEPSDVAGGEMLLRAYWRPVTGPFRTWKAGPLSGAERDDPVVNGNVLFALRLLGSPATHSELASVNALFHRSPRSRYYCHVSTIAHAAARGGLDLSVLSPAISTPPPAIDLLGAIQWLCAAPATEPKLIDEILRSQRSDGGWSIYPWVTAQRAPRPYWGSPAVTTALAIEALDRMTKL